MVRAFLLAAFLAPALGVPAAAQQSCEPRAAALGGVGMASVVAFTGPVYGDRVCAIVASLAPGAFSANIANAPSKDALLSAGLGGANAATLAVSPGGDLTIASNGPYVIAPAGQIPDFGSGGAVAPRVVIAYAGQRIVVIQTSPVALADLARVLRAQPDLFGLSNAVERAILIASGDQASISVDAAGTVPWTAGSLDQTRRFLVLTKR